MSHLLHRLRLTSLAAIICCLALTPSSSLGQFLFLDTNGDARSSPEDVLNPAGEPTTVNVYLDTSRNPDSSVAYCSTGSEPLSIVSYEFILHAVNGTVTFGNYTNTRPTMEVSLGTGSNSTDFYRAFGGSAILPPGLYQLGTLTVTVDTGSPTLNPATTTFLSPTFGTSFGTQCLGPNGDNTYKLGLDWHGVSGCGPPGGTDASPAMAVPQRIDLEVGEPAEFSGEFADLNTTDTLAASVQGLPPGLSMVQGDQIDGRKQVRVYGIVDDSIPAGSVFNVTWDVHDGTLAESTRTEVRTTVRESLPPDFQQRIARYVATSYQHGMPRGPVRDFGPRAVPLLLQMLTDGSLRSSWHRISSAVGLIGDTAYFDTLRAFVWDRFRGEIDEPTFMAIQTAQASLSAMATISPRVLDYLVVTANPDAWRDLQWRVPGESVEDLMASASLVALGYTDSDRAGAVLLSRLDELRVVDQGPYGLAAIARGALRVNARVRTKGYLRVWAEQDSRVVKPGE